MDFIIRIFQGFDSILNCLLNEIRKLITIQDITIQDEKQRLEYIYELHYHDRANNQDAPIKHTFQWLDPEINDKKLFLEKCKIKTDDGMTLNIFHDYLTFITLDSHILYKELSRGIMVYIEQNNIDDGQDNENQSEIQNIPQMSRNLYYNVVSHIITSYQVQYPFSKTYLNKVMNKELFSSNENLNYDEFKTILADFPNELYSEIKPIDLKTLIVENNSNLFEQAEALEQLPPDAQKELKQVIAQQENAGMKIIEQILKVECQIRQIKQLKISNVTKVADKYSKKQNENLQKIFLKENGSEKKWNNLFNIIQMNISQVQAFIKKDRFIDFMNQIL